MTEAQKLMADMKRCADALGIKPSTLGERIGQGGRFYARLQAGKRVWPETAEKARNSMRELLARRECELSHMNAELSNQGSAQ